MEELKGVEKLDKLLTKFVEKFGCTAEMGSDFCYWKEEELVNYTLISMEFVDSLWKEYVLKNFNYKIENIFMFSVLHEIGHHFTMDNFSKKQRNLENKKVEKIEEKLSDTDSQIVERNLNMEYFDLPMEKVATRWAVNYYKKNRKSIEKFYKKFEKEIQKFYELNS